MNYKISLLSIMVVTLTVSCSGNKNNIDSSEYSENDTLAMSNIDTALENNPATSLNTNIDTTMVDDTNTNKLNIQIGDKVLTATLVDNSSVDALKAALSEASITIDMQDYGNMEKVGPLGRDLPRNDEPITTEAGDIILFQGSALVIYYAQNSWTFTRLGKIDNISQEELKAILGNGDVTVTLSLLHK